VHGLELTHCPAQLSRTRLQPPRVDLHVCGQQQTSKHGKQLWPPVVPERRKKRAECAILATAPQACAPTVGIRKRHSKFAQPNIVLTTKAGDARSVHAGQHKRTNCPKDQVLVVVLLVRCGPCVNHATNHDGYIHIGLMRNYVLKPCRFCVTPKQGNSLPLLCHSPTRQFMRTTHIHTPQQQYTDARS
jgi:hypothetical protein